MPDKVLDRETFINAVSSLSVEVAAAERRLRLGAALPANADLDGDGVITGRAEATRLFTQIDSFGRNPDVAELPLLDPDGQATVAAEALAELGELTGAPEVKGWTSGLPFGPRADWSTFVGPPGERGIPEAIMAGAARLVREFGRYYGTREPWLNLDPQHALPTNVELGGLGATTANPSGVWKCNLFGGNTLALAGFEPPYYGNRGGGEYANANQFWKFSDAYASQFGNQVHFALVGEVPLKALSAEERQARLAEVLRGAQPGDLIMVDHLGDEVADGGHTRVVMENTLQADGSGRVHSAQATQRRAEVRAEGLSSFAYEEHLWVLRPNRLREATPAGPSALDADFYEVVAGDTLSEIAERALGSAALWPDLLTLNPDLKNPRELRVGMLLRLR